MADSYIVQDRTTLESQAIKVYDGQINVEVVGTSYVSEPIVEDSANAGNYWKIFVSDGQIGIESVATVQDDTVVIRDSYDELQSWAIIVSDGILGITATTSPVTIRFKVQKSMFDIAVIKSNYSANCARIE